MKLNNPKVIYLPLETPQTNFTMKTETWVHYEN